jgi:enamine deaminase RidA (YjgF/YER057c/UK114 family)
MDLFCLPIVPPTLPGCTCATQGAENVAMRKMGKMKRRIFITDARYGHRLTQIRREVFGDNFPGSALITITALAVPNAKIEIQGYAVIGGK